MTKQTTKITEPAHSLMYAPNSLIVVKPSTDTSCLYATVKQYLNRAIAL